MLAIYACWKEAQIIIEMSKGFQIKQYKNKVWSDGRAKSCHPIEQSRGSCSAGSVTIKAEDEKEKKFWSKHYFEKVIGRGGYGVVMLVKSKTTGQCLACKVIDREKASGEVYSSMRQEARLLGKLSQNKCIVDLTESFESKKRLFITMEYMKGGDLSQYIKQRKQEGAVFRESEAAAIVGCILRGLKAIHGHSIVHGDIKPGRPDTY